MREGNGPSDAKDFRRPAKKGIGDNANLSPFRIVQPERIQPGETKLPAKVEKTVEKKSPIVVFEKVERTNDITGRTMEMNILQNPSGIADNVEKIVVDGKELQLDKKVVQRVGNAINATNEALEKDDYVDCYGFATLAAGQTYEVKKNDHIGIHGTDAKVHYFVPTDQAKDHFDMMTPIMLVTADPDGEHYSEPSHAVVRLPTPDNDLYVHKAGDSGEIMISSMKEVTDFYGCTHAGQMTEYKATNNETGEELFTRRFT